MIIRVTFEDNDFMDFLEEYFKYDFLTYREKRLITNITPEGLKEWKEIKITSDSLLKKLLYDELTNKDTLKNFLTEDLNYYIQNKGGDSVDYLLKNLNIQILDKVGSQWENGEVLYYFCAQAKYIIM